jgi:hypothetical protein
MDVSHVMTKPAIHARHHMPSTQTPFGIAVPVQSLNMSATHLTAKTQTVVLSSFSKIAREVFCFQMMGPPNLMHATHGARQTLKLAALQRSDIVRETYPPHIAKHLRRRLPMVGIVFLMRLCQHTVHRTRQIHFAHVR